MIGRFRGGGVAMVLIAVMVIFGLDVLAARASPRQKQGVTATVACASAHAPQAQAVTSEVPSARDAQDSETDRRHKMARVEERPTHAQRAAATARNGSYALRAGG